MKTVLETVTPEMARTWLEKNTRNRPIRRWRVEAISRDLLAGKYPVTHQPIGIAPSFIVDGQHRLLAILEAGISMRTMVAYYDTDEDGEAALLAVDRIVTRTEYDVQVLAGVMDKATAKMIVPIIKLLSSSGLPEVKPPFITTDEIKDMYLKEKEHIDWAVSTIFDPEAVKRFNSSHRTAFAAAHMLDPDRVEKLAGEIVAADSTQREVALAWNKAAAQGKIYDNKKMHQRDIVMVCLRLIQAELQGQDPPKMLKPTMTTIEWFRTRIGKKRGVTASTEANPSSDNDDGGGSSEGGAPEAKKEEPVIRQVKRPARSTRPEVELRPEG